MRLFKSQVAGTFIGLLTVPCEAQNIQPATSNRMWSPQLQATKDDDIPAGVMDGTLYQDFRNADIWFPRSFWYHFAWWFFPCLLRHIPPKDLNKFWWSPLRPAALLGWSKDGLWLPAHYIPSMSTFIANWLAMHPIPNGWHGFLFGTIWSIWQFWWSFPWCHSLSGSHTAIAKTYSWHLPWSNHMAFTWQTPRFFHRFVIIPSHLYHKSTILYWIYFHFGPQDTKRTHMCIHTFKTNTHTHEYIYID